MNKSLRHESLMLAPDMAAWSHVLTGLNLTRVVLMVLWWSIIPLIGTKNSLIFCSKDIVMAMGRRSVQRLR